MSNDALPELFLQLKPDATIERLRQRQRIKSQEGACKHAIEKLQWLALSAGLLVAAMFCLAACGSGSSTGAASKPTVAPATLRPLPQPIAIGTAEESVGSPIPPTSTSILPASATPAPSPESIDVAQAVATASPVRDPAGPLMAPLTATPPNLATLAHEAVGIARVKVGRSSGMQQSFVFSADVTAWLKRPANLIVDQISIWIPTMSPAIMPRVIGEKGVDDWIVFLAPHHYNAGYDLVDPAGAFAIQADTIVAASLPGYVGRSRAQFEAEIAQLAPTPIPIAPSVHDLSILGQKAALIAEVQWPQTTPLVVTLSTGKRYLLNAPVANWLKDAGPPDPEFLGLALTQDEYDLLSHGSGHYILFLGQSDGGYSCISYLLPSYNGLVDGAGSVFEIVGDRIGTAGIPAYKGVSVQAFKQTLLAALPTPGPLPSDSTPHHLAQEVPFVQYIVEAELSGEGTPGAYESLLDTFKVLRWIKGGSGSVAQTLTVNRSNIENCHYLLGKGPYILFLRDHKLRDKETRQPGLYDPFDIYAIQDGTITFGSMSLYWGWPVARFEAAIRAVP